MKRRCKVSRGKAGRERGRKGRRSVMKRQVRYVLLVVID